MLRQLSDLKGERDGYIPRSVGSGVFFLETLIAMFGRMDTLPAVGIPKSIVTATEPVSSSMVFPSGCASAQVAVEDRCG